MTQRGQHSISLSRKEPTTEYANIATGDYYQLPGRCDPDTNVYIKTDRESSINIRTGYKYNCAPDHPVVPLAKGTLITIEVK